MDRRVKVRQNNFRRKNKKKKKREEGRKEKQQQQQKDILLAAELLKISPANFLIGSMRTLAVPPSCMVQGAMQPCSGGWHN